MSSRLKLASLLIHAQAWLQRAIRSEILGNQRAERGNIADLASWGATRSLQKCSIVNRQWNRQSAIQSSIGNPILNRQSNPQSPSVSAIVSLQSSIVNVLLQPAGGLLHEVGLDEVVDVAVENAIDVSDFFFRAVVFD